VAVGAQDQKCAAYGAGLQDGTMTISLGTAAAITKLWKIAKTEENNGVGWCGYIDRGEFVTEGVIGTAGTCLRWVRDMLFKNDDYAAIDREAKAALERGSSLLFHPYMNGPTSPELYPESTGVFYGINLATERGDIALAVMEGIAFQIRAILEAMQAYGSVHTLVLFGGGARSELWCQIISDITGMKINVTATPEAAGAGAAILAARAAGDALSSLEIGKSYTPSCAQQAYEEKYQKYKGIERKLWSKEN
jgi:xylulokinase